MRQNQWANSEISPIYNKRLTIFATLRGHEKITLTKHPRTGIETKNIGRQSLIEILIFNNHQLVVAESNAGVCPPLIYLAD
jgi:hypothetical protein